MDTFLAMDVPRAAIQTMESLYILATSKNISTIKGRYDFILTVIPTLKSAKNNSRYSIFIKTALEQFKAMYPASEPEEYQLAALSTPDTFDINEFYCNSLVDGVKRFYEKQVEEINNLKRELAKNKRITKAIETIQLAQNELQLNCSFTTSYFVAKEEIERIELSLNGLLNP